jgi:hypothetical protein
MMGERPFVRPRMRRYPCDENRVHSVSSVQESIMTPSDCNSYIPEEEQEVGIIRTISCTSPASCNSNNSQTLNFGRGVTISYSYSRDDDGNVCNSILDSPSATATQSQDSDPSQPSRIRTRFVNNDVLHSKHSLFPPIPRAFSSTPDPSESSSIRATMLHLTPLQEEPSSSHPTNIQQQLLRTLPVVREGAATPQSNTHSGHSFTTIRGTGKPPLVCASRTPPPELIRASPDNHSISSATSQSSSLIQTPRESHVIVHVGQGDNLQSFSHSAHMLAYASPVLNKHWYASYKSENRYELHLPNCSANEWKLLVSFLEPHSVRNAKITTHNLPILLSWFHELQLSLLLAECDHILSSLQFATCSGKDEVPTGPVATVHDLQDLLLLTRISGHYSLPNCWQYCLSLLECYLSDMYHLFLLDTTILNTFIQLLQDFPTGRITLWRSIIAFLPADLPVFRQPEELIHNPLFSYLWREGICKTINHERQLAQRQEYKDYRARMEKYLQSLQHVSIPFENSILAGEGDDYFPQEAMPSVMPSYNNNEASMLDYSMSTIRSSVTTAPTRLESKLAKHTASNNNKIEPEISTFQIEEQLHRNPLLRSAPTLDTSFEDWQNTLHSWWHSLNEDSNETEPETLDDSGDLLNRENAVSPGDFMPPSRHFSASASSPFSPLYRRPLLDDGPRDRSEWLNSIWIRKSIVHLGPPSTLLPSSSQLPLQGIIKTSTMRTELAKTTESSRHRTFAC